MKYRAGFVTNSSSSSFLYVTDASKAVSSIPEEIRGKLTEAEVYKIVDLMWNEANFCSIDEDGMIDLLQNSEYYVLKSRIDKLKETHPTAYHKMFEGTYEDYKGNQKPNLTVSDKPEDHPDLVVIENEGNELESPELKAMWDIIADTLEGKPTEKTLRWWSYGNECDPPAGAIEEVLGDY